MDDERACGDSLPIEDEDLITLFLRWGNDLWQRIMNLLRGNRRRQQRRFGIRLMHSVRTIPDELPPIEERVSSSSSSDNCSTTSAVAGSEPPQPDEVSLDEKDIEVLYSNTMMAEEDVDSILNSDTGDGDAFLSLLETDNVSVDIDLYEPQPGPSMPNRDISHQPRESEGLHSGDEGRIAPLPSPPVPNRELQSAEAAGGELMPAEESGGNVEEENPESNENQEGSNGKEAHNKSKDA